MLTSSQIKRTMVTAAALAAIAAPSASARPADSQPVPASLSKTQPATHAPTLADSVTRKADASDRAWRAANPGTTIVEVPGPSRGGGLDLTSIILGASIPLTLIVVDAGGKRVLRRRRVARMSHSLA